MSSVTPQQQKRSRRNGRGQARKGRKKVISQNRPKKVVRASRARRPRQSRGMAGVQTARTASGIGATSFKSGKSRTITVQNDEFIGAVIVANQPNFNVTSYPVNPGQASTFPWLARQSVQWEKYVFNQLEFYFKREVSEFATAGSAGKVIFSADFDASDAPPTSKQQMEDSVPHADAMPCENLVLRLPKAQMHGSTTIAKYVRPAGLPGSADIKTYDVAILHVATQGIPSNSEIGELRVRYSCTFSVPVLDSTTAAPTNFSVALATASTVAMVATTVPFVPQVLLTNNGLGATIAAGVLTLPAGNYLVDGSLNFQTVGTALTAVTFALQKNAGSLPPTVDFAASAVAVVTAMAFNTAPMYVSSNGTDTFNLIGIATYTGAAGTYDASIRVQAV